MWRHGDVLIAPCKEIPANKRQLNTNVLVRGEITGHSHRIQEQGACEVWESDKVLFLKVLTSEATLIHEEHKPIVLPRGTYKVWQQREYTPQEIRRIID